MEKIADNKLIELIEPYENFGVGVHSINISNLNEREETAKRIFQTGLKLGNYNSINGNVLAIGIVGIDNEMISQRLLNWNFGAKEHPTNVIVLYPSIVENSKGEKIYLGYTHPIQGYDQDTKRSIMDIVCRNLEYIPKEFIFGYYVDRDSKWGEVNEDEHPNYDVDLNPNFCNGTLINDELFNLMKKSLEDTPFLKNISDACLESLENLDITYFENAIMRIKQFLENFGSEIPESDYILYENIYKDLSGRINNLLKEDSFKK